jgi:LysM repeat protein
MSKFKRISMVLIALLVLLGATGFASGSAQASGCTWWHTVRWGESLSWIGRWYNVYWPNIASANGLRYPYTIYAGQVLCIPAYRWGGSGGYPYPSYGVRNWSFNVVEVVRDATVTVRTNNFPSNVLFKAKMKQAGTSVWESLPDLDSGSGGTFKATFNIPASLVGKSTLVIRLVQNKKNGKSFTQDVQFANQTGATGGSGGYPWPGPYPRPCNYPGCVYYVPTIWIQSVVRDSTVTFVTHNYPPNTSFDVLMGPMGTRGVGGYYAGSFNSGGGGSFSQTFSIPPALYGSYRISIRAQSPGTGYYSYNWFYNNTAYAP